MALSVLAFAAVGIRALAGRSKNGVTTEVAARLDIPSTIAPPTSAPPTTTAPASGTSVLDTTTPRLKVLDLEGRFEVTVPSSWASVPSGPAGSSSWRPFEQSPSGEVGPSSFLFVVEWFASGGCQLDQCALAQVNQAKSTQPKISISAKRDKVASTPAVLIDAALDDRRSATWVVVQGGRYWLVAIFGPPDGFDAFVATAKPVLATMSFG